MAHHIIRKAVCHIFDEIKGGGNDNAYSVRVSESFSVILMSKDEFLRNPSGSERLLA